MGRGISRKLERLKRKGLGAAALLKLPKPFLKGCLPITARLLGLKPIGGKLRHGRAKRRCRRAKAHLALHCAIPRCRRHLKVGQNNPYPLRSLFQGCAERCRLVSVKRQAHHDPWLRAIAVGAIKG
jgi:hypothetical protein